MEYVGKPSEEHCIFCTRPEGSVPEDSLILHIGDSTGVMLNKYPYSNGHLLVYPLRHTPSIEDLAPDESSNLFRAIKESVVILKDIFKPEGFNIGANIGKAAGAGVDAHIHFHVVPRWTGDVNFMPVIGDVKVLPENLMESRRRLHARFDRLSCS